LAPGEREFLRETNEAVPAGRASLLKRTQLASLYRVLLAVMIGLTERKIGLHDLLGKTRFLDGTPRSRLEHRSGTGNDNNETVAELVPNDNWVVLLKLISHI